jgi:hypothetical protein
VTLTRSLHKDPSKLSPDANVIHTEDFTIRDAGAISRSWGD